MAPPPRGDRTGRLGGAPIRTTDSREDPESPMSGSQVITLNQPRPQESSAPASKSLAARPGRIGGGEGGFTC